MKSPFVIVIAGPTGVGKTTLSKMLSKHFNSAYLSEDGITRELFPNVYKDVEDDLDKLQIIENQLLKRAKEIFDGGGCIVIDRINLNKSFIEEIKRTFNKHLTIKVLWPPMGITIERDKRRAGWTSGEDTVGRYYQKYKELKSIIGEENYIDNGRQTPGEMLDRIVSSIELSE